MEINKQDITTLLGLMRASNYLLEIIGLETKQAEDFDSETIFAVNNLQSAYNVVSNSDLVDRLEV